jgi:GNAT superfamily N-acetyltransferase
MNIITVQTAQSQKQFLNVVDLIYKHHPAYVRPLDMELEAVFDPAKNPFFKHGSLARWIIEDDAGTCLGRVAAFINEKKAYTFEQATGGMGFFECIENPQAARLLMDTARNWLAERGMEAMDGPINFGENDNFWGLLIEGFTHPSLGMNYNPPYYQAFFEDYGFKVYFEQISNHLDISKPLPERFFKIADWVRQKPGYHFEHLNLKNLDKYSADFREVYNNAWQYHENFSPMTDAVVKDSLSKIKDFVDERFIWFAYVNNEPAAFMVTLPDLNQVIKHMHGKSDVWAKMKFLYYRWRKSITRLRVVIMGVKPAYQKLGLESALIKSAYDVIMPLKQYTEVDLSWVGDFNPKMRALHESVGARFAKKHITYRCLFSDSKDFKRSAIIARDTREKHLGEKLGIKSVE